MCAAVDFQHETPIGAWRRMEQTAFPGSETLIRSSPSHPQPEYLPIASSSNDPTSSKDSSSGVKSQRLLSGENTATCTPWLKKEYSCDVIGLHEEILDFYSYMQPRRCEKYMRLQVIDNVKRIILSHWPRAQVFVFGSFCTNLYLPTSDIDLVVIGEWPKLPLFSLEEAFIKADIAVEDSILVLDKTAVPIIKFTDKATEVKVDISFNQTTGIQTAHLLCQFIQLYPMLPPLAMIVKQFLAQRQLNEVYYGGINSYSLILMLVSFFQLHPRNQSTDSTANLGVLLIEFFELYGRQFNYMKVGISVLEGGYYFPKDAITSENSMSENGLLYIQDPLSPSENASRGCYGIQQVKLAFEHAFNRLHMAVLKREKETKPSLLSVIVQITEEVHEYRNWVESQWPMVASPAPLQIASPSPLLPAFIPFFIPQQIQAQPLPEHPSENVASSSNSGASSTYTRS